MYHYDYTQNNQIREFNSEHSYGDYSGKTEISSQAKDSVTFYIDNSGEPATLYSQSSDQNSTSSNKYSTSSNQYSTSSNQYSTSSNQYSQSSNQTSTQYSNQYFADHQNDRMLRTEALAQLQDQVEIIPSTAPSASQVVSYFNRNVFNISLRSNRGQEEVVLAGDKKLFMKTMKAEIMKFLNEYQVTIATFCDRICNRDGKSFSEFFGIDDWDFLKPEDKLTYYKLSSWVREPATKRMYDLIQKEADAGLKAQLTSSYVTNTTVPVQRSSGSTLSLNLPDVEITPVPSHTASTGPSGHSPKSTPAPEEPVPVPTAPSVAPPGRLRTVTTLEERNKIKTWGLQNLSASARERGEFARSLGVTKSTVDRIINYEKKMKGIKDDPPGRKEEAKGIELNGRTLSTRSYDQEKVKAVIQHAVKSGSLKLDNKKPLKIVMKTKKNNDPEIEKANPSKLKETNPFSPQRTDLKFNRIALDSFFKNKENPTAEQIDYFVRCTQVPREVTEAYLAEKKPQYNSKSFTEDQISNQTPHSEENNGILPKLSKEQKLWFENFLKINPAPDVQAIIEFSKSIGMSYEDVALTLELWDFEDSEVEPQTDLSEDYDEIFRNLDPELAELLREINQFRSENYPPALERELRSMFGKKVYCILENIKAFALQRNLDFHSLYKKLNSRSDYVQLVSEETCKKLLKAEDTSSEYYEKDNDDDGVKHEVQEDPIPEDNWLTNNELFGQSDEDEASPRKVENQKEENPKRKSPEKCASPSKKQRVDENDSGYSTPSDTSQGFDLLSNIIMENIGEVNMLNDSLDLFNESIQNIDLINEMYEKVEKEDRSQLVDHLKPKTVVEKHEEDFEVLLERAMEGLKSVHEKEGNSTMEKQPELQKESLSDLRRIFQGPYQNFEPTFQIVNIQQSFNDKVFEVELSDGEETSRNFYFKSRASELAVYQMIKLKQLRYAGSKICVEVFEILDLRSGIEGTPTPIEESYFRDLRSNKVDSFELSDIVAPRTIMEYINLEENLRTFMERNGFYPEDQGEKETSKKQEILFKLCQAKVKVSSKIIKILSKLLKLEKDEIENFLIDSLSKLETSSEMLKQDHSYFNQFQYLSH